MALFICQKSANKKLHKNMQTKLIWFKNIGLPSVWFRHYTTPTSSYNMSFIKQVGKLLAWYTTSCYNLYVTTCLMLLYNLSYRTCSLLYFKYVWCSKCCCTNMFFINSCLWDFHLSCLHCCQCVCVLFLLCFWHVLN